MNSVLTQFAAAPAEKQDLFASLGIDWMMLLFQAIAFLVLLAILAKFVYPSLLKVLDKRDAELKASSEAAQLAEKNAQESEQKTAAMLKKARDEANEIVATARDEASSVVEAAQKKASDKAEALVRSARDEISKEVQSAKKALHNETLELVATATGLVVGEKISAKDEAKLINKAIGEAR